MKIIRDLPQHLDDFTANPEWLAVRAGKFTGSDFHQYLGINGKGLSDTAESNLYKKVLESMGEIEYESTQTEAMARGNELEPEARAAYWAETGNDVEEVAFVDYEKLRAGCSPDGIIVHKELTKTTPKTFACGDVTCVDDECVVDVVDKIIEIKCPEIKNYLKMAKGKIPPLYKTQIQYNMLITGAKKCDFIVYHPGMKLYIEEIEADTEAQKEILEALEKLNDRYDNIIKEIEELKI